MSTSDIKPGATLHDGGVTFAIHSRTAEKIELCLFDAEDTETARLPLTGKTDDLHHIFVPGVKEGQRYGYRAHGRFSPAEGFHFDPHKLLLDPYAKAISKSFSYVDALSRHGAETAAHVPKGIVTAEMPALPPRAVPQPSLIYELNVRGFTLRHPDVPPEKRGTISALAEPAIIAHFKSIGVDCIELMPIAAWIDERHLVKLGLRNAWGYNPVSFFAIEPRLAPGGLFELRDTIEKLHAANISVILDVVFNHTGEGDTLGPTLSYRGIDNASYYRLFHGSYVNDAGTGNVLALERSQNVQLVIDVLRHWVLQTGVDGFRFDLAPILGRNDHGFQKNAPLIEAIETDPILASRILIAEPWDIGPGGYQLGNFPSRWFEWNDRYRDDVRRFWRGDTWSANGLATRLAGSSDVFSGKGNPSRSINFISAHDGFTLKDLLTYREKQNLPNGENNRDGKSDEVTCTGANARALLATLVFSRGTPMITAGDEFGRTQHGNNNAYAQDNEMTWLDWTARDVDLQKALADLINIRRQHEAFFEDAFLKPEDVDWLDNMGKPIDWQNPHSRVLVMMVKRKQGKLCIAINGSEASVPWSVAAANGKTWRCVTAKAESLPAKSVHVFQEV